MTRAYRLLIVTVLILAVLLSLPDKSHAADRPILVIGDSITYGVDNAHRYTRTPGDPMRAWYSFVSEATGLPVQISAQPGSGFINNGYGLTGKRCTGKNFGQRTLWNIQTYRPKIIIIEGGRNDLFTCRADRTLRSTSDSAFVSTVKSYMSHLKSDARAIGLAPSDVYVIAPWGQRSISEAWRVRGVMRKYALANGFQWISTGFLSYAQAPDGGHPNADGVQYLVGQINKNSNLMRRN